MASDYKFFTFSINFSYFKNFNPTDDPTNPADTSMQTKNLKIFSQSKQHFTKSKQAKKSPLRAVLPVNDARYYLIFGSPVY